MDKEYTKEIKDLVLKMRKEGNPIKVKYLNKLLETFKKNPQDFKDSGKFIELLED